MLPFLKNCHNNLPKDENAFLLDFLVQFAIVNGLMQNFEIIVIIK